MGEDLCPGGGGGGGRDAPVVADAAAPAASASSCLEKFATADNMSRPAESSRRWLAEPLLLRPAPSGGDLRKGADGLIRGLDRGLDRKLDLPPRFTTAVLPRELMRR